MLPSHPMHQGHIEWQGGKGQGKTENLLQHKQGIQWGDSLCLQLCKDFLQTAAGHGGGDKGNFGFGLVGSGE